MSHSIPSWQLRAAAELELRRRRQAIQQAETGPESPFDFARRLEFEPAPEWQAEVLNWTGKRMLLNCARQSGKSTVTALLAVHRAVTRERQLILLISPSLRQSSELFRKVREHMRRLTRTPDLEEDNKLSATLANGSRIVSLPGNEETIRGFSAVDLLLLDEASRIPDALYKGVRPMLAVSGGAILAMSTPFGKRGWWYEAWANGGQDWDRIIAPATINPRITAEFLEEERRSLGEYWFAQEYLCEFMEATDQLFGYDLVMRAISAEVQPLFAALGVAEAATAGPVIEPLVF